MVLKLISETKDGHIVHRKYSCPCGDGYIAEEQDYTPGHRDAFVSIECKTCQKHYKIDYGSSNTKWRLYHNYTNYFIQGHNAK